MTETKRKPGRPKGSKNTRSGALRHCLQTGQTPVEYLTSIYQDPEQDQSARVDAAKAVAPYVHAKYQNISMNVDGELSVVTGIERTIVDPKATDG